MGAPHPSADFTVGAAGLGVQVFILVPWHHEISEQVQKLEEEQRRLVGTIGQERPRVPCPVPAAPGVASE